MLNKIKLELPTLHPAQLRIVEESRRYNTVSCGRRWGKTVLGQDRIIQTALSGLPAAWFSPTYKLQSDAWRTVSDTLAPVTTNRSEQEKRIELITQGVVDFWSLDSPDAARGRRYATIVIDEAAMVPQLEEAWTQSLRPTLTDFCGSAWFLSTPRGVANYFYRLYQHGHDPLWTASAAPTWPRATCAAWPNRVGTTSGRFLLQPILPANRPRSGQKLST